MLEDLVRHQAIEKAKAKTITDERKEWVYAKAKQQEERVAWVQAKARQPTKHQVNLFKVSSRMFIMIQYPQA